MSDFELDAIKEIANNYALDKTQQTKIPAPWKVSRTRDIKIAETVSMFNTDFGLYAAIPFICKGEDCPYAKLFLELHEGKVEDGERCPVEVAFIMSRYDAYKKELGINPESAVDNSLLRDLIDCDIQILRADNKIALTGDYLEEQIVGFSEASGEPIYKEDISPTANYKDRIQNKRNKILEMFNSTRKDKQGSKINISMDPSSYATNLLKKADRNNVITLENSMDEVEIIEDVPYMKQLNQNKAKAEEEHIGRETPQLSFEELYADLERGD